MESIIEADENHLDELTEMCADLWPEDDYETHKKNFRDFIKTDKYKIFLYIKDGKSIGFIFVSVRTDYVEGSDTSPTGYVEGIYIKESFRKKGIAKKLLAKGENWLKQRSCKQIGSDAYIDNKISYDFHLSAGFKDAGKLVAFIKDIN